MSKTNELEMPVLERVPFYRRVRGTGRGFTQQQVDEKKVMNAAVEIMNETHEELRDTITELRSRLDHMEANG